MRRLLFGGSRPVGFDSFTGTNGTGLTSHAMDLGPGWTQAGPGSGAINNNRGRLTGVLNNTTQFTGDFKQANVTVQAVVNYINSDDAGLIARCQDANNSWKFDFNHAAQQAQLYETNASSNILRGAANYTIALATDYTIKAVCQGQVFQFWVNGVAVVSYVSPSFVSATSHGIFIGGATGGSPNVDFDNFQVLTL